MQIHEDAFAARMKLLVMQNQQQQAQQLQQHEQVCIFSTTLTHI
jgi:hypothetical protein